MLEPVFAWEKKVDFSLQSGCDFGLSQRWLFQKKITAPNRFAPHCGTEFGDLCSHF